MYDDVLVPTDGSESAEQAARIGGALADAYDATLHVLSVVDERDYDGTVVQGEDVIEAGMSAAEKESHEAVASVATQADGDVTTHVTVGVPSKAILDYISTAGVDLVVMGTHGRTGVERFIIGSVAEKVVRRSDVPVVTVRLTANPPTWPPIDRLLVPTDGSEASFAAVPYALDLAERFGATVDALYVVDERTKSRFYNVGTALKDVVGGLETAAAEATERIETRASARGVDATSTIIEGLPSRAICEHAEASAADLVVMSTHGRTGLAHYLLGSVTERVVRNATVPVLTAPVGDDVVES